MSNRRPIPIPTLMLMVRADTVRRVHFYGINLQVGDMEWVTAPALANDFLAAVRAAGLIDAADAELKDSTLNIWF